MLTQAWEPQQPFKPKPEIQVPAVQVSTFHKQRKRGRCATSAERAARLQALTGEEYTNLLGWAKFTAKKFGGRVNDADGEDLLHEAILRAVDERNLRSWYLERVEFLTFLRGCIRSIADEWCKRARTTELPDELSSPTKPGAQAEAAIMIEKIRERVKKRPHALAIIDLKRYGMTAREIQESLGISEGIYAAAVKWIERTLKRDFLTVRTNFLNCPTTVVKAAYSCDEDVFSPRRKEADNK